jgi:hypothetical protein
MKLRHLLISLGALALFSSAPAATGPSPTDERLEKLEQRVEKIDQSLDQILLLLQKQQAGAAHQPAPPTTAPAASPVAQPATPGTTLSADTPVTLAPASPGPNLKPGMLLDVWSRPSGFRGGVPAIPSLLTVLDARGPLFALNRYAADKELASSVGKPLLLVWRGYLQVKQAGAHVLIAEFRRTTDKSVAKSQPWGDFLYSWSAQLSMNGTVLLDETNRFASAGKGTLARNFTLNLDPGFYAVQIVTWLPKQAAEDIYDYSPLTLALRLREPGALKPRDLGPADFVCGQ